MIEELLANRIAQTELELASYQAAYLQLQKESEQYKKLQKVIDDNPDLKELVDEAMKGE